MPPSEGGDVYFASSEIIVGVAGIWIAEVLLISRGYSNSIRSSS